MPVSDEILTMVHAFPDSERKHAVRSLAHRVQAMEALLRDAYPILRKADRWSLVDQIDAILK